jgi:hypothetical protein
MEDLLCGIVGYSFGKYNRQISEALAEDLITNYLRDIPLERVIDHWTKANGYDGLEWPIIARLRYKADDMERNL